MKKKKKRADTDLEFFFFFHWVVSSSRPPFERNPNIADRQLSFPYIFVIGVQLHVFPLSRLADNFPKTQVVLFFR